MGEQPWRPTKQQLADAYGKTVPDLARPGLEVLFCGINPGLYTAAVQHHFGRPGNRFWKALHLAGFTPGLLNAFEEDQLLDLGFGITNLVDRATAAAAELGAQEFRDGANRLAVKVARWQPHYVAFVGIDAFRTAFRSPKATIGRQGEAIGETRLWVLPSTSGLQAHYQLPELSAAFRDLRVAAVGIDHRMS